MSDGGKGSRPRPLSISQQEYESRWDAIFSRDLDAKSDERLMEMPGTIGSAKIIFKEQDESSGSNTNDRNDTFKQVP